MSGDDRNNLEQILENERQEIIQKQNNASVFEYDIRRHTLKRYQNVPSPYGERVYLENVPESVIAEGNIHPEDVERFRAFYEKVNQATTEVSDIFRLKEANGNYQYYQSVYKPVEFLSGKPVTAVGYSENVSSYMKQEIGITSEVEKKELINLVPTGLGIISLQGEEIHIEYLNQGFFDIIGMSKEKITREDVRESIQYVHPEDCTRFREIVSQAAGGNGTFECDVRILDPVREKYRWFWVKGRMISATAQKVRFFLSFTDITMQHGLIEREQMMNANVRSLVKDRDFTLSIQHVLRRLLRYYQADRAYIFEYNWDKETVTNTYEACKEGIQSHKEAWKNRPVMEPEIIIQNFADHEFYYVQNIEELAWSPDRREEYELFHATGKNSILAVPIGNPVKPDGFLGVDAPNNNVDDIEFLKNHAFYIEHELTKRKLNEELFLLSYCDALTHLSNRNSYIKRLKESKGKECNGVGVLFGDVNGLKYANDNFGHAYGDEVICNVANLFRQYFDEKNIYRISGDEFVILEVESEKEKFLGQAHKLEKQMQKEGKQSVSCGYIWEERCSNVQQMIAKAENLMYINKQQYYAQNPEQTSRHHKEAISFFMNKIQNGNFIFYLQPQIDLRTGQLYGAEALVRKVNSDGRIVNPYEFIPALEKTGLIAQMDFFMLESVCKYLERNKCLHIFQDMVVSANFSRITIQENNFEERVLEIVNKYDFDLNLLELEITESASSINLDKTTGMIRCLNEHGLKIALDDLGVEYASLSMMVLEGVHMVKIDRSFIGGIENNTKMAILVRNVVRLAHELGLTCLAEGVETKEQLEILKGYGCDYIQGFYVDKPLPVMEFEDKYKGMKESLL